MRLLGKPTHFDFLGWRFISLGSSWAVILVGFIGYFLLGGLNYGIDFSGGTLVQVKLEGANDIGAIRQALTDGGIGSFSLQAFGDASAHEFLVSVGKSDEGTAVAGRSISTQVETVLKERFPNLVV